MLIQKDELPDCHWKINGTDVQGSQSGIGNWNSLLGRFMCGLTHPKTQKKQHFEKCLESDSFADQGALTKGVVDIGDVPWR